MIVINDTVWANQFATTGLPYRARVLEIKGEKACILPLQHATTIGVARSNASGASIRKRWVKLKSLAKIAPEPSEL